MNLYICSHCGNIITKIEDKKVPVSCCGELMKKIEPNTFDGAVEKHVPKYVVEGNLVKVSVGEVAHPMLEAHFIKWIILETNKGFSVKYLNYDQPPYAEFLLTDGETIVAVYEFCNLHGVWKA